MSCTDRPTAGRVIASFARSRIRRAPAAFEATITVPARGASTLIGAPRPRAATADAGAPIPTATITASPAATHSLIPATARRRALAAGVNANPVTADKCGGALIAVPPSDPNPSRMGVVKAIRVTLARHRADAYGL